ncbi:MAG: SirB1 family protein [Roseateles sp.]
MSDSPYLKPASTLSYFAALVAEDESLHLLEAAAAIAQDRYPDFDVQAVLAEVDELARRLHQRLPADAAPAHRLRLLNHFFSQELGFAGNLNNYYEVDNSYVHRVLRTRRGIPVSLAVIYLELAAQIGLQACGVSFPGHFLIKLQLPQGDLVLDPLRCEPLSREALEEALQPFRADWTAPQPLERFLRPATSRQILARMLRNLKEIHRSEGDASAWLAVQQRLVLLLPGEAAEWRDRGLAQEAVGHWQGAVEDLGRYLKLCPDASDAPEIARRLQALVARGAPPLH